LSERIAHISVHFTVHNCVTQYSIHNSSDNLPSYPLDNCSTDIV